MLLEFGRGNWIQKARQQPQQVQQVIQKFRKDGIKPTLNAVFRKLDTPTPLGYCNAGVVLAVGKGVTRLSAGDRVASNGPHAEIVSVPHNLVVAIPEGVTDEDAAFTPLAAIALEGIRLAAPTFGERIVVIGLGLIGNLTVQLLRASGCQVIGLDINRDAVDRANHLGIEAALLDDSAEPWVSAQTEGMGADAVLLTTATAASEPVSFSARVCRQRGRIVLIGTAGLNLDRTEFFKKELSFQVSGSYGPGRYDPAYEGKGQDYPAGYVRWTAGRNFEAVLQAMASKTLQPGPLVASRQPLGAFETVYDSKSHGGTCVFEYSQKPPAELLELPSRNIAAPSKGGIGLIGAGQFAQGVLLPAFQKLSAPLISIASAGGLSAGLASKKFGIPAATNNYKDILADEAVDLVAIATRHHDHAHLTIEALQAGKHVFVEKPLALSQTELDAVTEAIRKSTKTLTVGFNRRFAPLAGILRNWAGDGTGMHAVYTVNAGALPKGHWAADPLIGGGRLIGEGCHFLDFCSFLAGSTIRQVCTTSLSTDSESASILVAFCNGSTATVNYITTGSGRYDKERVEVHRNGQTAILQNWRRLDIWGAKGIKTHRSTQDKGHTGLLKAVLHSVQSGAVAPIALDSLLNSSRAAIAAVESLQEQRWITV
jgi:predicted dehydrogenase/NADPH:quinone reductase-like Zn-dependent oxidoreductase